MPSPPSLHGYHYVRDIGTGGSSCVYLYEQSITERLVAVKVGTRLLNDAGAQDRFRTEASAMARIADHPGILSIYDAGITSDSHGYLVLEYAANGTFAHPPHDMRPDTEQLLSVAITLCSALQTAHAHGILHRDIKPSNILISDARTPLLADFGIASSLYSFSSIPGYSVAWAPPEVLRGTDLHTAGESSDIYSLAASLVGILTGSSPYELAYGPHNKAQLAEYIRTRQLPPFSHMGVPSFLEPALSQALAFDPNERYYSALDFARALQRTQQRTYGCQTPVIVRGSVPYASSNDEILSTPQQLPSTATLLAPVNGNRSNTPPTKNSSRRKSPSVISHTSTSLRVAVVLVLVLFFCCAFYFSLKSQTRTMLTSQSTSQMDVRRLSNDDETPVPSPVGAAGKIIGTTAVFTWKDSGEDHDSYSWTPTGDTQHSNATHTDAPSATLRGVTGKQVCINVSIVTASHRMSQTPTTICATRGDGS